MNFTSLIKALMFVSPRITWELPRYYIASGAQKTEYIGASERKMTDNIYKFSADDIDKNEVSLGKFKGSVLLISNTAYSCKLKDKRLKELSGLLDTFGDKDLKVLLFPSNSFWQDVDDTTKTKEDLLSYNKKFQVFDRTAVNGDDTHPLFQYLKDKCRGLLCTKFIKWNFTVFLVNKYGIPVKRYGPSNSIDHKDIEKEINKPKEGCEDST